MTLCIVCGGGENRRHSEDNNRDSARLSEEAYTAPRCLSSGNRSYTDMCHAGVPPEPRESDEREVRLFTVDVSSPTSV